MPGFFIFPQMEYFSQAKQSLQNIGEILEAAGGSYKDVIKTTVLMRDISEFSVVNNIYSDFFSHHQPARAAFQVAALPKGGDIEIEAVAIIGESKTAKFIKLQITRFLC